MQYYFYILNTLAFLVSLLFDFYRSRKISIYTSLLFSVFILETICGHLLAKWLKNNIVSYNLLLLVVIAHYIAIYGKIVLVRKVVIAWILIFLSTSLVLGFGERVNTELYIIGLFITSYFIISYFYDEIFLNNFSSLWTNPKTYIGLGILVFFTCSFPLLLFFHSITKLGGAYSVFYDLLIKGNIILSISYLITAISRWKKV